jgi:hypothetical protein
MRPDEPVWLKEWRIIAASVPKLCHTCDHYNGDGMCEKFDMYPPEEFAETKNACEKWEIECGF